MTTPAFKFIVECETPFGLSASRFTNEKHAKLFCRNSRKDGHKSKLYSIGTNGKKDKEIKTK